LSLKAFSAWREITDLPILSALNSLLIVDDAHGIGVLGNHGKGICEFQHLTQHQIPCLITPLGKALGSFGAIVSGENDIIETILQFARTYCFTTALPPAISHATLMSLKLLQQETWRRETLHHLIDFFITNSHARGLNFVSTDKTPIKSILVNSNTKALDIQKKLLEKNLFVSCIRPPTVPKNTARIRISLNCSHTEIQITQLLDEIYHLL
jgi:8-amino-7-oxononanoate synthase